MSEITIADGLARAVLLPEVGASLARYDYIGGTEPVPFMRPSVKFDSPIDLASFPMVPWSGRISGGGFSAGDRFRVVPTTFPGFESPIHGNGWTEKWTPRQTSRESAVLELESTGPGPFRYSARLTHRLDAGALIMELLLTNRAAEALPYGAGFHPWFPRTPGTRLNAPADGVWINDATMTPLRHEAIDRHPDWDFRRSRPLPDSVDNCFTGWPRKARIDWTDRGIGLAVEASQNMGHYVLYSPSASSGFFCFEPVSHAPDAHNLAGAHGLCMLGPDESLTVSTRLTPLL
jgi:aldose 1-epimerase